MLCNLQACNVCYRGLLSIFPKVAVLKHRLLFQTMVVVPEHICMNIIVFIFFYHSSEKNLYIFLKADK